MLLALSTALLLTVSTAGAPPRRNVLMLAVDDLRAEFGASFGSPVRTQLTDNHGSGSIIFPSVRRRLNRTAVLAVFRRC